MKFVIEIHEYSAGVHRAMCPALPGFHVAGCTPEDARSKMEGAICAYLHTFDTASGEQVEIEVAESPTSIVPDTLNDFEESFIG